MSTTVQGKFDYIVLLSPTFIRNKTYVGFAENDRDLLILTPLQGQINNWLKIISLVYAGTNTLIILDDCATARDVKQRTNELVNYAFSARHKGISIWVLTKQIKSIEEPFREHCCIISLLHTNCQECEDHFRGLRG